MRFTLLKNTLVWAMICGLLLSPQLWLTERSYPFAPVVAGLGQIPPPWDGLYYVGLLVLLGLIVICPRPRGLLLLFVGLVAVLALLDQTRWQPWVYQYLFMFAALAMGATGNPDQEEAALNACRLIVAAMYIWSGLQKVNVSFATGTYPWLLEPLEPYLSDETYKLLLDHGWTAAFTEFGLGLALLIWPVRPLAVIVALGMHALILFCLWKHQWNTIVWPWNVAMMAFVLILFVGTRRVRPWHIVWPRRFPLARVTLVLFGVMPLLNFFELWDSYLSAALYSGNTPSAQVTISPAVFERLPEAAKQFTRGTGLEPGPDGVWRDGYDVDLFDWAIDELNVPSYPAPRVYRQIAAELATLGRGEVVLIIEGRPDWRTKARHKTWEIVGQAGQKMPPAPL